jgi:diguanylate cyclase (GGDEF)-like protein
MNWDVSAFSVIQVLISLFTLILALLLWQRRAVPGSKALSFLMLAVTIWALATGIETASVSTEAKIFWSKIQYIGIAPTPVFFLTFILEYTNQEHILKRLPKMSLWIFPILTFGMAATNELHGLMWTSFTRIPGSNLMIYGHGAWFWLNVVFTYGVLVLALVMLVRALVHSPNYYRQQAFSLVVSMIFPWLGNIVYVVNIAPGEDLTPAGFAITGVILAFSMARLGLFDLIPVARERVIDWMELGFIVLDDRDRIVDLNEAAEQVIGQVEDSAALPGTGWVGQSAARIAAQWADFAAVYPFGEDGCHELSLGSDNARRFFELRVSHLSNKQGGRTGKLLLLHDITRLKVIQQDALRAREIAMLLHDTSNVLSSAPDLAQGLDVVLEQIRRVVVCDGGIFMLNVDGCLKVSCLRGLTVPLEMPDFVIPAAQDNDAADDDLVQLKIQLSSWVQSLNEDACCSMCVPIYYKENLIGMLLLFRRGSLAFSREEEFVAQSLVVQVSIALENARMFAQMQSQAITDALTGLNNRRHFFTLATNLYDHAERYGEPYAIIMLDIDHFKQVNDRYGHLSGDEVLRELALRCKSLIRKIDIIGRYGGEEFVLALPNTDLDNAMMVAERMRHGIDSAGFTYRGQSIRVTVSQGVAAKSGKNDGFESVLERADKALFLAKHAGRNCVKSVRK